MARKAPNKLDQIVFREKPTEGLESHVHQPTPQTFFEKIGNKAGVTATILGLIVVGALGGKWQESMIRLDEIRKINVDRDEKESKYREEISDLKAVIRELRIKRMLDSIKINKDGKENTK